MTYRCLFLLLISSVVFGQAPPSATPKKPPQAPAGQTAKPAPPNPAEVAPDATVMTIQGVCEMKPGQPKPADCKTAMTRAQFERLIAALNPQGAEVPAEMKRQVAENLAKLMAAAHRAEEMGLQDKPQVQELLRLQRMGVLMQELVRTLREQFAHSSPEELQKYYDAHKDQFEEATFKRVYIPKAPAADNKPPDEAAFKATADKIRQEAVAGADFDKLQQEALTAAGIKAAAPETKFGPLRLVQMPEAHKQVFALKVGEVSPLVPDPNAFVLYKMESRRTVPLEEAKADIEKTLQAGKLDKAVQDIGNSANPVLNPAYFSAPSSEGNVAPPAPPAKVPAPPPAAPPH